MAKSSLKDAARAVAEPPPVEYRGGERMKPGRVAKVNEEDRSYMLAGRYPESWRVAVKTLMAQPKYSRVEMREILAEALGLLMERDGIPVPPI